MKKVLLFALLMSALLLSACQAPTASAPAGEPASGSNSEAVEATATAPSEEAETAEGGEVTFSGEPLRVAVLAPLSGQVATYGTSVANSIQIATDEWNAKGGVLGRKIELVIKDSQCAPDPAVNAANQVVDEKISYLLGEVCSGSTIPITDIAENNKILMLTPTATNPVVTLNADGSTRQFVFRSCFIDPFQGTVIAKFALDKGYKTAFVVYDQGNDYSRGLSEFFEKSFSENGGTIVGKETYTKTDTDFSAILAKVAEANPDVMYVSDYYNIINLIGAQAKEKGIPAVMMGGDGWDSADLDTAAADGGYYSNHYDPADQREVVQNWVKKYGEKVDGKTPDALGTLAYDGANILYTAIEKAGVDDTAKVAEAMASLKYEGVTGIITFDEQHNPIKSAVIIHVTDGQKVYDSTVNP